MRLASRAWHALVLIGTWGCAGSPASAPEPASARATPAPEPSAAPAPPASDPPAPPAEPPPPPEERPPRDDLPAPIEIGGRRVRIVEPVPGGETSVLHIAIEAPGAAPHTFDVETGATSCERGVVTLEPVEDTQRLAFVQAFCEHGEDEFSRSIVAVVLDVGDATHPAKISWRGTGSYGNSFGRCERIDVPFVRAFGPGRAVVSQRTEVISRPNPERLGGGDCRAVAPRTRKLVDLAL